MMNIHRPRGFSLIELMVALVIAAIILLGLSAYFVSSSRAFSETERVSRQIENGRYASALLAEEIRHAGFYGEVGNVVNLPPGSAVALPGTLPDLCETAVANLVTALPLAIQGLDAPDTPPGTDCIPDRLAGTDVLVVRRAHTTTIPAASAATGGFYTQTANCLSASPVFKLATSAFNLKDKDCSTDMPIRQYHVYIYYVAKCSIGTGTGGLCASTDPQIPTLKRAELITGGTWSVSPLVEGIENMQIEYGLDNGATADGVPDIYKAKPASVAEWAQVAAIRLHLLARNTDITNDYTDTKTYTFGLDRTGAVNKLTAPGDSYRRHNYTELVRVQNVSQRNEASYP